MSNRTSSMMPARKDFLSLGPSHPRNQEEPMVDERDGFRPSEFVQRKLQSAMDAKSISVSMLHSHRFVRR